MRTSLFVAADRNEVIGAAGDLPWDLPEDRRRFKRLTSGHVVVCGRLTHESIVRRLGRPLPGRFTVVATRQPGLVSGDSVIYQPSVGAALSVARGIESFAGGGEIFVIGGAEIYAQALGEVDRVYLTRVHGAVQGDTSMPLGWLSGFRSTGGSADPAPPSGPQTAQPVAGIEAGTTARIEPAAGARIEAEAGAGIGVGGGEHDGLAYSFLVYERG